MNDRVWIKDDNGCIYYCEIRSIEKDEEYRLAEYEVFPIIGVLKGFTTVIGEDLIKPTSCLMWIGNRRPFGRACYDLDVLMKDGK